MEDLAKQPEIPANWSRIIKVEAVGFQPANDFLIAAEDVKAGCIKVQDMAGPFAVSVRKSPVLTLEVSTNGGHSSSVVKRLSGIRRLARQYKQLVEVYFTDLRKNKAKYQAADEARKDFHAAASYELERLLLPEIVLDYATAKNLFSLLYEAVK